jgi:hypothetical protein
LVLICALRFELVAQEDNPTGAARGQARIERAKAMVVAAEETYKAESMEYEIDRVPLDNIYVWSRRRLDADNVLIALQHAGDDKMLRAERLEAFERHLARMEKLHERVAALHKAHALGGEASQYHATRFYVAEAKFWAEDAKDAEPRGDE